MEDKKSFDTLDIFVFLWKKRKPLIIVTAIGAITSVIVSLMLTVYYKAETVLFPTTFIAPSTSLLHISNNQETDPLIIGDEDDLERLIQILNSDYIKNKIIEKYDLINHYGLSPSMPHLKYELMEIYNSCFSYQKTQYQGVVVSVVDVDPQMAADMANDIAILVDSVVYDMQKQRKQEAYDIALKAYNQELIHVQEIEDSLDIYRQKGVLDYRYEVERYSEAYGKAIGNNQLTQRGQDFFDKKFDLLQKHGKKAFTYALYLEELMKNLTQLHVNLVQAEQDLNKPYSHKYVISYADAPDKKDSPKRSIIVILSTLGSFMFAIFVILLLDFYKDFRVRIKEDKKN